MTLSDRFKEVETHLCGFKITDLSSLSYGTAGFRLPAHKLSGVAIRLGILACLRSVNLHCRAMGIMITASHNPPCDNGIKLVDPDGGMLDTEWEPIVVDFMRCPENSVSEWLSEHSLCTEDNQSPHIVLGYDTRESSPALAVEAKQGIDMMHGVCHEIGLVTTPQLHYFVQYINTNNIIGTNQLPDLQTIYVDQFAERFTAALENLQSCTESIHLNVDCAHGVGYKVLENFKTYFSSVESSRRLILHLYNKEMKKYELLNKNCGADFVKITMHTPKLTPPQKESIMYPDRWATIDGDADRLIYFRPVLTNCTLSSEDAKIFEGGNDELHPVGVCSQSVELLDGDRISCLFAHFLVKVLKSVSSEHDLTIGVVQTAYANSASTRYLTEQLNVSVVCVPTGVKHLHHAAQNYDFGIYFEANGHGTVLFSTKVLNFVENLNVNNPLRTFVDLTNTSIGDAIADILLVEYTLAWLNWSLVNWFAMYKDLPSKQLKVTVAKRDAIKVTWDEKSITNPVELQVAIDEAIKQVDKSFGNIGISRAFVRPSGTENAVRVYAESYTHEATDWLAATVSVLTYQLAGGVGPQPTTPEPLSLNCS
uniref:Phosphoacetylglucosamine mutase n=1 Tax=Trichobilharzia regenti TaxID=157069 RepID=A0AA85KM74_TRIRE|nr:unnamed protein product [Trichobilharzia regenti]